MNTNRMALVERLRNSMARIGKMCGDGTPPRMSIPVRQDDDDVFICAAIKDAIAALQASEGAALMAEAVQIEPILMQPRATFTPEIWETAEWAIPLHIHPLDTDTWDVPNCAGNWTPPTPEQVRRYIAQAIHRYIEAVQVEPVEQMTDAQIHKGLHKDFPESSENMRLAYFAGVRFAEGRAALEAAQVAQEQRPDYRAGFIAGQRYAEKHLHAESVSAKPLTKKQILELIHAKHVHKDYVLRESDRACLDWYELGLRDGEAAHGIKEPS